MKQFYFTLLLSLLSYPFAVFAQTAYLPLHSEDEYLIDRLETKSGTLSPFFFGLRPIARKDAMNFIQKQRVNILHGDLLLSAVDRHNIQRAESINSEWVSTADGMDGAIPSRHPILGFLYPVQPDALHVHTDDFFLVVNPVVYATAFKESGTDKIAYSNIRGIELRGRILDKVGFYTMLADDQERPLSYVQAYEQKFRAFPGRGYYVLNDKGNYDMFLARGYVDAAFIHDHLNITFGYDHNFSGVGMRSLFLSDFAPPATFLRLRGHWNRWVYQSLFLQLTADMADISGGDHLRPQKYAAIHQLGYQAAPWLQAGLFESSIFGTDILKVTDLIPVIGYQTLAQSLGTHHQKTSLGLWAKAIALKHLQFYGQAYIDRLSLSELSGNGWWGNQLGIQLGGKYFDAFSVPNLDLQGEINVVRPFTYAAGGDNTNYTHYNQPLAHPYGAGFGEVIGKVHYQPLNKLYLTAKAAFSLRGSDTTGTGGDNGVNPFIDWNTRIGNDGYGWLPGDNRMALYLNFNAAYELRPNLFLEAGIIHWNWETQGTATHSTSLYGGLRWNISRTEYDSY